ncbi:hypothetical protein CR513_61732, partial [Mucuna pruriens]
MDVLKLKDLNMKNYLFQGEEIYSLGLEKIVRDARKEYRVMSAAKMMRTYKEKMQDVIVSYIKKYLKEANDIYLLSIDEL